jgi:heme-degrading monooxygenase HmoA
LVFDLKTDSPNHPATMEHTVTFRLKHPAGSPAETDFLVAAEELAAIPGVRDFRICRQVSPKNSHAFGISMDFDSEEDFQAYCKHPLHDAFVQERWIPEVEDFQEADFEVIP